VCIRARHYSLLSLGIVQGDHWFRSTLDQDENPQLSKAVREPGRGGRSGRESARNAESTLGLRNRTVLRPVSENLSGIQSAGSAFVGASNLLAGGNTSRSVSFAVDPPGVSRGILSESAEGSAEHPPGASLAVASVNLPGESVGGVVGLVGQLGAVNPPAAASSDLLVVADPGCGHPSENISGLGATGLSGNGLNQQALVKNLPSSSL